MGTPIAEIASNAMVYIDDIRLTEALQLSEALFYRKMWTTYISNALPLLSRPPQLLSYLQNGFIEPQYDSYEWMSDAASLMAATEVDTGKTGYDICSVVIRSNDGTEATAYSAAVYDAATGKVTFPEQDEQGLVYEMDFYKDGQFSDMTPTMKRLFGLATAVVWDEHFDQNFLNWQPKIGDASFSTVNEANFAEKSSQKVERKRQSFNDELRKYEQDCAYKKTVSSKYPASNPTFV